MDALRASGTLDQQFGRCGIYCFAVEALATLYGRYGFVEIADAAPDAAPMHANVLGFFQRERARREGLVLLRRPPSWRPPMPPAEPTPPTRSTDAERWAARCNAVGLGYLAQQRSRQARACRPFECRSFECLCMPLCECRMPSRSARSYGEIW